MDEVREIAFTPPPPSDRVHEPLISSFALIINVLSIPLTRLTTQRFTEEFNIVCLRGASSLRNAAKKTDRIAFFIFVRQMMILDVVATCNFEFSQLCPPPLLSLMAPPANWISNQSGEEEVPPLRLHGWHARHQSRPNFKVKKNGCPQSSKWIAGQSP